MKKFSITALTCIAVLTSCTTVSTTKITKFDTEGRIVEIEERIDSVAKVITDDVSNKTVVITTDGWGISCDVGAQLENALTPTLDLKGGKFSATYISALKDADCNGIAEIIKSTGGTLSIGRSGIVDTDTGGAITE